MRLTNSSSKTGQKKQDQWLGDLWQNEIELAKTVFGDTLPYGRISIGNVALGTTAVTVATSPIRSSATYILLWTDVYGSNATDVRFRDTFIHELTHVWQAEHGSFAMAYMAESVWAQLKEGTKDIFKDGFQEGLRRIKEMIKGGFKDWDHYRDKAYHYTVADIGKPFSDFNVEQQAGLVETWFSISGHDYGGNHVPGGKRSPKDIRYPYIKDNILAKNPAAPYAAIQNPRGYSPEIADIQATLFALGYIKEAKHVDGFMGDTTRNAVRAFQKRNKLAVDGDIGGPNSFTRRKLRQDINTLVRAQ